jgi:hypothetical protein
MLEEYPGFQVMIFVLLSSLSIMYLIYFKPYEDPFTNKNEIFNEACVLLSSYQLFIFTDYVTSLEVKKITGYLMIATILLNFGTNIIIQVGSALCTLPRACRRIKNSQFWRKHFGDRVKKDINEDEEGQEPEKEKEIETMQTKEGPPKTPHHDLLETNQPYYFKDNNNDVLDLDFGN